MDNNYIGRRFGKLIIIGNTGQHQSCHLLLLCLCDCGKITKVRKSDLRKGKTKSCGCSKYKHGDRRRSNLSPHRRLYKIWRLMKARVYNKKHEKYHRYGGRGISICGDWRNNYLSFKQWALANGYNDVLTIDRIDNDSDYKPGNCQWLTGSENVKKYYRNDYYRYKCKARPPNRNGEE